MREFFEFFEVLVERVRGDLEIDFKVAVHENVAEICDRAEPRAEFLGQYPRFHKAVDRRRVVR